MEWIQGIVKLLLRLTGLQRYLVAWELKWLYLRVARQVAEDSATRKSICDLIRNKDFFNRYVAPLSVPPEQEWEAMVDLLRSRLSFTLPQASELAESFYRRLVDELESGEHLAERRQQWLRFLQKNLPEFPKEPASEPHFNDSTYIRYFFYFADEAGKLVTDHNKLAMDLGCPRLAEEEVNCVIGAMDGGETKPYEMLHCQSVTCLLHAVKDTLIWQVIYSAGKQVSDPKAGWEFGKRPAWENVSEAYGTSELFVVNVKADDLKRVAERLYDTLREISPELPPSPAGGEAEGAIGYLRWIGNESFLLLVREGSEETKSADFQCGTFPRLMMQFHKARHYEQLIAKSVEMVINVMHTNIDIGLGHSHLRRLIDTSMIDIETMIKNIEAALKSYDDLFQEWAKTKLPGEVWEQLKRRIEGRLQDARHKKEKLENEKKLLD